MNEEAAFHDWFRAVYKREWLDIKGERQDMESLHARWGWEAGYQAGRARAASLPGDGDPTKSTEQREVSKGSGS